MSIEKPHDITPVGPVVSQVRQAISMYNSAMQVFRNPDEAIRRGGFNRADARAMRRDLAVMCPLQDRILTVAEFPWHIQPENPRDKTQALIATDLQRIVERTKDFLKMRKWLLECIWFGCSGVQLDWRYDFSDGGKVFYCNGWQPVHGDTLEFKFDGTPGLLVNPMTTKGDLPISTETTDVTLAHFLYSDEVWFDTTQRERFVIAKHNLEAGDFFEPEAVGAAVRGLGVRSVIYWTWYMMAETRKFLGQHMETIGANGITLWFYQGGNTQDYERVKGAAESQSINNNILIPWYADNPMKPIERFPPDQAGVSNLLTVLNDYYGKQVSLFIRGETLGGDSGTGKGGDATAAAETSRSRIERYDAINLAEALTNDFLSVIIKYNYGSLPFGVKFVINPDRPDAAERATTAATLHSIGVNVPHDELRSQCGFTKPDADEAAAQAPVDEAASQLDQDQDQDQDAPQAEVGGELRGSVGGSQALLSLQQSVYSGAVPREAAVANARIVFGFSQQEAEALFPNIMPVKTADDDKEEPQQFEAMALPGGNNTFVAEQTKPVVDYTKIKKKPAKKRKDSK